MNDTFNIKRFGWVMRKAIFERPIYTFGLTGLVLGSTLLIYSFFSSFGIWDPAHNVSFLLGLAGGGSFLVSSLFNYFSSSAGGASHLTTPASHFEKWLCCVVVVICFSIIFLLFYRAMDTIYVSLYLKSLDPNIQDYKLLYEKARILSFHGEVPNLVYMIFLNSTGAMLLGSLYFNKVSFVKVSIIICIFFIATFILNFLMAKVFFNNVQHAIPFTGVAISVGKEEGFGFIDIPAPVSKMFYYTGYYVTPACLWLLSLLRLKEKEF